MSRGIVRLDVCIAAVAALAVAVGACQGEGPDLSAPGGRLTDPRTVATATPWAEAPELIPLEEATALPPTGPEQGTPQGGVCAETYVVQAGDTPSSIAQKCGVDVDELMELNGIDDPTNLQVGQELRIPQGSGQSP